MLEWHGLCAVVVPEMCSIETTWFVLRAIGVDFKVAHGSGHDGMVKLRKKNLFENILLIWLS